MRKIQIFKKKLFISLPALNSPETDIILLTFQAFALLLVLPALASASASTGSYATFSHHGATYGYNHGHPHGPSEPIYYSNQPKPAAAPAPHKPEPKPEPAPYKPEPTYKPEPAYKPEPYKPAPYHKPAPAPYKPAPYHHPAPAPYKPAPYHPAPAYKPAPYHPQPQPHYGGYEEPKHNCSVEDVTESAEVCTPTVVSTCENVEVAIKRIVPGEYCYEVASTVCTETEETFDNEVCTYNYEKKYEETTAKTVEVTFKRETDVQMVTVCQPHYGYGYSSYGRQYCKEVAQETSYNVPVVSPIDVPVRVGYPEASKSCVNKPITLPRVSCETKTEQKCVQQPEVEEDTQTLEKCTTKLGEPECQQVELNLPKQVCKEIVYGYAEDKKPAYPQPQPAYPSPPAYPAPHHKQ